jgi:5-methylcytosine-specific restriction protein A
MCWRRPTPFRLGRGGEGDYVQRHGFGHEDWNFNTDFTIDGYVYGYVYYQPSEDKSADVFNFAFLTWDAGQWHLAGFYREAEFVLEGAPVDAEVVRRKVHHLRALDGHLGEELRGLSDAGLRKRLSSESEWLRWRVRPWNIQALSSPIPIPRKVYASNHFRITKPKQISKRAFDALARVADESWDSAPASIGFEEGRLLTATHLVRERSAPLVDEAKRAFVREHRRLFCQGCGFDFVAVYGERGRDFIEVHHSVPLASLSGRTQMRAKDLRMLCSNCHRIVHRYEPWLSMEDLAGALGPNRGVRSSRAR